MQDKVKEIIRSSRRTGSSTWILEAAMQNPKCVIIAGTGLHAKFLEHFYTKMVNELPWYKRYYRKFILKHNTKPIFTYISVSDDGYNLPVIFDNSALE